jgi:hypothetical protein
MSVVENGAFRVKLSPGRRERLEAVSDPRGVIGAVAIALRAVHIRRTSP